MQSYSNAPSVVICAYTEDRWSDLCDAIRGVQAQSVPVHDIVLVIDHNPSLLERARFEFSGVTVIANSNRQGLAGARNAGIAAAQGTILAFMDEDAVPAQDWLERLLGHYADLPVVGVGGAIEPLWHDGVPEWFPQEFLWVVGCTYRGMPTQVASVRNLIGCNMSFRREVLDQVGGFRDGIGRIGTLPVGCEETELCIRVQQKFPASVLRYEPQARVKHRVTSTRSQWKYFVSRCYAEGISKAQIKKLVGDAALATEKGYVTRTLPGALLQNLRDVLRGDRNGLGRASAIVGGLWMTTAGYVWGKTRTGQNLLEHYSNRLDATHNYERERARS